jgi:hypothetical protein
VRRTNQSNLIQLLSQFLSLLAFLSPLVFSSLFLVFLSRGKDILVLPELTSSDFVC